MLFVYPLTAQKIVGTDVAHAALLLWVAGVSHLAHGDVDRHALAWLLVGSIPGVLLGANLSIRVPERGLRVAFGVVLVLSGIKIVDVPRLDDRDRGHARRRPASRRGWWVRTLLVRRVAAQDAGVESPGLGPGALDGVPGGAARGHGRAPSPSRRARSSS